MSTVDGYNEPLGPPMPRYFAKIVSVRLGGNVVTGSGAIAPASQLTFDLEVYGLRNTLRLTNVASVVPPPANGVDVNCSNHAGKWVDVGYLPGFRTFLPFVPLTEDNAPCE